MAPKHAQEAVYKVAGILEEKRGKKPGSVKYLVDWEPTWEIADSVSNERI
jgi:hypothetical protein